MILPLYFLFAKGSGIGSLVFSMSATWANNDTGPVR